MIALKKRPYIPLTNPEKQMDAVFDFCTAWGGPIILDYDNRKMVLMPFTYYLEHLCSPEEAAEIKKQMAEYKANHTEKEEETEWKT